MPERSGNEENIADRIVSSNLEKMKGEMEDLLRGESIGGNAGRYEIDGKKFPCGAANAQFNRLTGEIVVFGNIQDNEVQSAIERDKSKELWNVAFRVAIDIRRGPRKIIQIIYDNLKPYTGKDDPVIADEAKIIIERTVEEYNRFIAVNYRDADIS